MSLKKNVVCFEIWWSICTRTLSLQPPITVYLSTQPRQIPKKRRSHESGPADLSPFHVRTGGSHQSACVYLGLMFSEVVQILGIFIKQYACVNSWNVIARNRCKLSFVVYESCKFCLKLHNSSILYAC